MQPTRREPRASFRVSLSAALALAFLAGCGMNPAATLRQAAPLRGLAALDAPADYYQKAEKLSGKAMLLALHTIVSTHQKDLGYDGARDVMFRTIDDADGDDAVTDVYTNKTAAGVTDRTTAYRLGLNTEHTWPQSMGAKGIAKDDLHHLFPAENNANTLRGNLPFGEVAEVVKLFPDFGPDGLHSRTGYAASSGVGFSGKRMVFEPRATHKGDAARALLYFYMRYAVPQQKGGPSLANFAVEEPTLLRWNAEDPVSPAEAARNEAIYKVQGNRNPFVDHPEWVQRIGHFMDSADAS